MADRRTLLTSGDAPAPIAGVAVPGQVIGGYRVIRQAGVGGMGVVYEAVDDELGRRVALKLIAPEFAGDERFRELFKDESRKAAALEHPNVIPIYRSGEDDGQLYIAMRFVEGASLERLIDRRGRLPVGATVRIVSQVADALDAAHAHGLVHRDVKPGNVLLADAPGEEHVYLTDFGLSVPVADGRSAGGGRYAGTPAYLAPEQIRGAAVDARTDVYALGCVLFHALTGRVPFDAKSSDAMALAHLTETPPGVSATVPGLPGKLDEVVRTAMAKRPDDRFASAGALAAAAREARADVVICSHPGDATAAAEIAGRLGAQGLDARLAGGDPADDLWSAHACLVLVGRADLAVWARDLLSAAGDLASFDPRFRLVSVLLPGSPDPFDPQIAFLASRPFVDLRGGIDDPHATGDLLRAVDAAPLRTLAAETRPAEECPYRGLEPFREEDAALFFGRERESALIWEKLRDSRFLAVLGASGSGKSSLVRAGVLPRLRAEADAEIIVMTPGAEPLAALAAHLAATPGLSAPSAAGLLDDTRSLDRAAEPLSASSEGRELVVVVDQFEEAFTLCQDVRARRAFIDNLTYAATIPGGHIRVILAMRADFYHRAADHPTLRALVAEEQFLVGPLDADGLRRAIEEPARQAGLELERGLVRRILTDVADQPGALPLMEHLLLELWRRRRGRFLTLEAYTAAGGVSGALAKRANDVYLGLDQDQQAIARRVLLRLTQPGEGTEDTRRRAPLSELVLNDDERAGVEHVVDEMSAARLLVVTGDETSGEPTVEVTHEALIRGWPELRSWIETDRENLRLQRRLTEAADEWDAGGRDDGMLYRGARLGAWQDRSTEALNQRERDFLAASRERAERDRVARRKRVRLALAGLGAAVLAVGAVAGVAISQWRSATRERETAISRQLAGSSTLARARDPELALLLAEEAYRAKPSVQAEEALRETTHESRIRGALRGADGILTGVSSLGDGRVLVAAEDGAMRIWDQIKDPRGTTPVVLAAWKPGINGAAVVAQGYVGAGNDGSIVLWPSGGGAPQVLGKQTGAVIDVSPSPDGRSVLSAGDAGIWRWDLVSGRGRRIVAGDFIHAMFTPQPDSYIATVGGQSEPSVIRIVDGRTDPIAASGVQVAGLSGDGKLLGLGTENGLEVWSFGKQAARIYTRPIKAGVNDVAFDAEGDLATANGDGSVSVYAARTGVLRTRLLGHDGPVPSVTFAPGGRLVSAGNDGSARSWAWSDGRPVTIDAGGLPDRGGLHYDASGQLITVNPLGAARIWNVAGTGRSGLPAVGAGATSAAVSTDGRLVVTGAEDGTLVARNRDGRVAGRWKVPGYPLVIALDRTNTRIAVALLEGPVVEARIGETKVRTVTEGTSPAFTVGFSPDGTLIASGTQDGAVMVARGTAPGVELASHDGPVFATEFSPDGRRLATASGDKTVSIWDPATGQLLQTLRGHNGNVEGVAWVDDDRLVSAGADAVRVWDWQRGVTLLTLPRPDGATQVAVTGDGPTIADYGIDTPVSVSNCDVCGSIDSVIALASQRTTRELTAAERRDFQVSGSP